MQNRQNQTEPGWLSPSTPTALGTGVFLVPNLQSDAPRAVRKEFVKDLTYQQCVQRGDLALVFKWVPHSEASLQTLQQTTCGMDCVDTCSEPGCACFDGKCV
jgi:hypothetical protein